MYFYRKITDGVDFNNVIFQYFNFNRQKVTGIELETKITPVKGFTIAGNYTYIHPSEQSQSRITFKDSTYDYLIKRPGNSLNITAGYQCGNGLYVSVSGKYAGTHYDVGGYQEADVLLKSYLILGAYAQYELNKSLKLFLNMQNITGKKFFDIRGYNSIPFMINGGATFYW